MGLQNALVVGRANTPTQQQPTVSVVRQARTRITTDLDVYCASIHTLRQGVTTLHPVCATLAGQARTATA